MHWFLSWGSQRVEFYKGEELPLGGFDIHEDNHSSFIRDVHFAVMMTDTRWSMERVEKQAACD